MRFWFAAIVALLLVIHPVFSLKCLDDDGNEVDSWVAISDHGSYNYFIWDSKTNSDSFRLSPYLSSQTEDGALMATMGQVYDNADSIAYAMYSDQPPPDGDAR